MSQTAEMTIKQYLRNETGNLPVTDGLITNVLLNRGIPNDALFNEVYTPEESDTEEIIAFQNKKRRDLCTADLILKTIERTPTSKNNSSEADGQWKSERGGYQFSKAQIENLKSSAYRIYSLYGETDKIKSKGIRLESIGKRTEL